MGRSVGNLIKSYSWGCAEDISISELGIGSNWEFELPKAHVRRWTNGWEELFLLTCWSAQLSSQPVGWSLPPYNLPGSKVHFKYMNNHETQGTAELLLNFRLGKDRWEVKLNWHLHLVTCVREVTMKPEIFCCKIRSDYLRPRVKIRAQDISSYISRLCLLQPVILIS